MRAVVTTIKLNKKSDDTQVKVSKPPMRRTNAVVRDRSVAPTKTNAPVSNEALAERKPESRESANQATARTGQRNHRFDGKARENSPLDDRQNTHYDYSTRSAGKGEQQPCQVRPQGVDTRTTPRPDKNEPQYRQAPRRGGKVRDGYDAVNTPQYGAAAKAAYKSVAISTDLPRLSKIMAERGICSRREADEWIMNSWVMVDGVIIDTLGTRINPDAEIVISSYAHEVQSESVTIILHKPVGYVSGQAEDDYQPAIVLVHPDNEWLDDPELNQHHEREFQRR